MRYFSIGLVLANIVAIGITAEVLVLIFGFAGQSSLLALWGFLLTPAPMLLWIIVVALYARSIVGTAIAVLVIPPAWFIGSSLGLDWLTHSEAFGTNANGPVKVLGWGSTLGLVIVYICELVALVRSRRVQSRR